MTPFSTIVKDAHSSLQNAAGTTVRYLRDGSEKVADLKAVPANSRFEQDTSSGVTVRFDMQDFLVSADDLVDGDAGFEPEVGDTIEWTREGATRSFQVLSPGGAAQAWEYRDPSRELIRIHTRFTEIVV